jgi:8-oxo-dGTP pyrophosphatase MutT (NUDIX family)
VGNIRRCGDRTHTARRDNRDLRDPSGERGRLAHLARLRPLDLDAVRSLSGEVTAVSPRVLSTIRSALLPAGYGDEPTERQAAVAVVLLARDSDVDVLLIRRAERADDHWSGHMAFPGGRRSAEDPDLLATAIRETREEVGLDLAPQAELLGRLPDISAAVRAQSTCIVVRPFVFAIPSAPPLVPNHEVVEALWAPLGPMMSGALDTTIDYIIADQELAMPGYRVGDHIVWGLTHRMLLQLFDAIERVAGQ